jgi:hypothetical protein
MGEELVFTKNDCYRGIERLAETLRAFESPRCDPRVKAMILTKLQEARLLSLELIKPEAE